MNINKIQTIHGAETAKPQSNQTDETGDFASVLKESTTKAQTEQASAVTASQEIRSPLSGLELNRNYSSIEQSASQLLDELESYQQALANPSANLRQVQPMVDALKAQADLVEPMAQEMPTGDALKGVVEETLLEINKEYARFSNGEYVD